MNIPNQLHPYQAWLGLGHIDDPKNATTCVRCGMLYEHFKEAAKPQSCNDERELNEITKKKLSDTYDGRGRHFGDY